MSIPLGFQITAVIIWHSGLQEYNMAYEDSGIDSTNSIMELTVGYLYCKYIKMGTTTLDFQP